jgi:hypothetical protein
MHTLYVIFQATQDPRHFAEAPKAARTSAATGQGEAGFPRRVRSFCVPPWVSIVWVSMQAMVPGERMG